MYILVLPQSHNKYHYNGADWGAVYSVWNHKHYEYHYNGAMNIVRPQYEYHYNNGVQ